jgi:DNA-binding CsgD family transcriptional regulator/ligand-binding sensor domain-containing protein/predicted Holliday junction resolvase-like endonuclease
MRLQYLLVALFCIGCFYVSFPQERPPIEIYTPADYGGETQNWSISQSKEKYIYVANNKGLLEFNGAEWQLYPSPSETIMRSVKVIDDKIYTGSYREFGYWKKNILGVLTYTSLSQKLKIPFLGDEEFWNIIGLDEWILFQSLKTIYLYNKKNGTYTTINSETIIYKMFKVNEGIYFQKTKDGIYKIENGDSKLISNHPILKDNLLVNVFNYGNKLLIQTEDNGFYVLDNNALKKWDVSGNETISKTSVYRSIQLRDNSFVLGTISDGIIHLTPNGEIKEKINYANGLSNNTVLSIFEDIDNNIWLGLDNGINCVNMDSPFSIYNDQKGKLGTVYASAIFENNLYLGTNQGLYYRPLNEKIDFKFIEGTQSQVWCLVELNNTLFCGHNSGTFVINNDKAKLISDIQGTWNIKKISGYENRLLQGNYDGLYVLEKRNGNWCFKNKILGFETSSRYFELHNNNEIFVSHEHKGVFNIKVNKDFTKALEVTKDSTITKGLYSSLLKYNNEILFADKKGVLKYDSISKKFQVDTLLNSIFKKEEHISGRLIADNRTNKLWSFSIKNLNYLSPGKLSNVPETNKISLPDIQRKVNIGFENIYNIKDQKYLIGTTSGYIVANLDKLQDKEYNIIVNSITKSDLSSNTEKLNKSVAGTFKNKENNIEFKFSVAEYDKFYITEYQYQLEGIHDQWSEWSTNPHALFNNLPYGNYVFNVRAKVGNKITSNIETYNFKIERPWILSNLMIAVYTLTIMLFSLFMHNSYKQYYRKQRDKLLEKTSRELELKELENKQQLMRFNNDKLRQDIENKNRELGISTMSLIKKNEFLNNIKKELKNANETTNLKYVIKIIDRNLNNTDDWHLFEVAFNNADKDFLKKIKIDHPSLTSNDLRLCAYLRLNLASKEIAPLLNISPKSVEVKRYRLRKKLDLTHESSLSDYILEI